MVLACVSGGVAMAQSITYALGTFSVLVGPAAGNSSVVLAVSPQTEAWTASTNSPWLHLDAPFQSGIGSTNVIFNFDANSGETRTGTLTIAGQTLTVTQAGSTYITAQTTNTLVKSGLNQPRGVAVDHVGNVFIADTGNSAIKEWTKTNRTTTTIVSSGLNGPDSVAVDGQENVYITDTGNNAVREWVAASNNVSTLVSSGLSSPSGVALDPSGNVYIADGLDEVVFEWIATNGSVINLNIPNPNALCYPPGLAVDTAGNVYFDDTCGDSLGEWTAINSNTVTLQCCWFYNPTGVAVDGSGNVYIADQADNWVWEWSAANRGNTMTVPVSGFNRPGDVAVDGQGNLYIADTDNNAIEEWSQVYMDPTPKVEGLAARSDFLPAILPESATQLASFSPVSNEPWLTITGVTNGVVYFSFTSATSSRTGTITIFGQSFPVTQQAGSSSLGTSSLVESPGAGTDSVVLAVYPTTNIWTATANADWLHLNQNGTGSTDVIFSFDSNPGTTRTGTLTVAGRTLTVTQAGSTYIAVQAPTALVSGMRFADGDAVDPAGNVYIAVADQDLIEKWTPTNDSVAPIVSSGLTYPTGVAADGVGNVYFNGAGIKKWTAANGNVTQLTTASGPQPAVDALGNVYFSSGSSIQVWTAANNIVSTAVSGLNGPSGVAVDVAGNLYINDGAGIQEWTPANNTLTVLATPVETYGNCMAVDGRGNVYLASQYLYYDQSDIFKWSPANNSLTTLMSSGEAQYFGVTVDSAGNVYFTDAYDGLVQELPDAFLDPTPKSEGLAAGNDSLPAVVPSTLNLHTPFAPSTDSSWLTITGVTNGVVSFSFTENLGLTRLGHVNLLDQSIPVMQTGPTFTLGATNLYESPASGTDSVVLTVSPNIGIWTATPNVPWLHVAASGGTGSTNVIFSFDLNTGSARCGTLTIAGQTLTVTQAAIPNLTEAIILPDGIFQFSFSDSSGVSFTVVSSTNLLLPVADWDVIGVPTNIAPGFYQFDVPMNTSDAQRFYRVRSP